VLPVHPTEIAFDIVSAERAIEAVDGHPAFGFNYDPSHLGYQGVDYVEFVYRFRERIFHAHMKDVAWSATPAESGVFGGHLAFGDPRRYWEFRSLGRGSIDFERVLRALNDIGYKGPEPGARGDRSLFVRETPRLRTVRRCFRRRVLRRLSIHYTEPYTHLTPHALVTEWRFMPCSNATDVPGC